MKLALAARDGKRVGGMVDSDAGTWCPISGAEDLGPSGLAELIGRPVEVSGEVEHLRDVVLLPPIPRPQRNIVCVGKNYAAHAQEFSRSGYDASSAPTEVVPDAPIFFTKAPSAVVGPDATILAHSTLTSQLDYEAELAVVLSVGGRDIPRESALTHVGYYTAANDITARDLQRRHKQWFVGKSLDTSCPLGPWLVSADEVELDDMTLSGYVNDELRQHAKVSELIFDIPTLIATLSQGITLEPGDILLTGTPAGVGIGMTPPQFLSNGDRLRVVISGIGELQNVVGE